MAASSPPILPTTTATTTGGGAASGNTSFRLFLSRLSTSVRRLLSLSRPWPELLDPSALSRPDSFPSAFHRLRRNISYFRLNYSLLLLLSLSLSLLSHPLSLLLLLSVLSAWSYLYVFRPAESPPLTLIGRTFSDREILAILSVFTFVVLFFTSVGSLIVYSLTVGSIIVCIHGALRVPEDLFLEEQEAIAGASTGGGGAAGVLSFLGAAASAAVAPAAARV